MGSRAICNKNELSRSIVNPSFTHFNTTVQSLSQQAGHKKKLVSELHLIPDALYSPLDSLPDPRPIS
jgi:hypothetical protein